MIDKTPDPRRTSRALPPFTPVPRHYNRHDGWTPDRQQRFIAALAETGSVKSAAHAVNMTPEGAYLLRRHPEGGEFAAAWQAALDCGVERLEDVALDRALNGTEVPVYVYGKLVGTRRIYNDALLMFILRNRANHRFNADTPHTAAARDDTALARLKRQWRAEWEAELAARQERDSEEVLRTLNEKLDRMRAAALARAAGDFDPDDDDAADDDPTATTPAPAAPPPPPAPPPGTPRIIPALLTEGDRGVGLPTGVRRFRTAAQRANPGEFPSIPASFPDPPSKDAWERLLDAGLIGGKVAASRRARLLGGAAKLGGGG